MNYLETFQQIMKEQLAVAIATSVDNQPNVRIVNFYYNDQNPGVLYFATFKHSSKVTEFQQHDIVAFTTVPLSDTAYARVKQAVVKKSKKTIYDLQDALVQKIPNYASIIEQVGENIDVYELHFSEVNVALDFMHTDIITL